jgi:hypothetical protein
MAAPKLSIRKRMLQTQGKVRPTCSVQAVVEPATRGVLETHFLGETLFRRAAYSLTWPEGTHKIPAPLAPSLAAFLKNDACPEITVKTLLSGQTHQGANAWEVMSFELIAKVAFDNLVALIATAREFDHEIFYTGASAVTETQEFEADTSAEVAALNGAVAAA